MRNGRIGNDRIAIPFPQLGNGLNLWSKSSARRKVRWQGNLIFRRSIKNGRGRFMPPKSFCAAFALAALASIPLLTRADTPFTLQSHPLGQSPIDQIQVDLNNDGVPDLLTSARSNLTSLLSGSGGSFTLHSYGFPESASTPL